MLILIHIYSFFEINKYLNVLWLESKVLITLTDINLTTNLVCCEIVMFRKKVDF